MGISFRTLQLSDDHRHLKNALVLTRGSARFGRLGDRGLECSEALRRLQAQRELADGVGNLAVVPKRPFAHVSELRRLPVRSEAAVCARSRAPPPPRRSGNKRSKRNVPKRILPWGLAFELCNFQKIIDT